MEHESKEELSSEQAVREPSFISRALLPAACVVVCVTGFLYAWFAAFTLCPDLVGRSDWQFRLIALPMMLLLGGIWALLAWRIRAGLWTAALTLLSLAWSLLLINPPIEGLWNALIAASAVCAAGVGVVAQRMRATVGRTSQDTMAGVVAVLAMAGLSVFAFVWIGWRASSDVCAVMLVCAFFAITTVPLLGAARVIGSSLPRVQIASERVRKGSVLWPLLPMFAIVPAVVAISVLMSRLNAFQ